MRSTHRVVLLTLVAVAAVVALGGLAYMYSGRYNVAASVPHNELFRWVLQTTQRNSVQSHAKRIDMPAQISSEELQHGIEHYHRTCVQCHGAPGMERGELGKGLNPTPPDLAEAVPSWTHRELFWIVKHGIKMTGMPAFGATHSDEELWGIVGFLKQLPQTSPEQYKALAASKSGEKGQGGEHADAAKQTGGSGHAGKSAK